MSISNNSSKKPLIENDKKNFIDAGMMLAMEDFGKALDECVITSKKRRDTFRSLLDKIKQA